MICNYTKAERQRRRDCGNSIIGSLTKNINIQMIQEEYEKPACSLAKAGEHQVD